MSNQLFDWDETEHDRTGGPSCGCKNPGDICAEGLYDPEPDTYGIPLQEQVEQVEDALSKAISVIEALVEQEKELRNDVYQAQLDAQDWQNKYNQLKSRPLEWDLLVEDRDMFQEQSRVRGLQLEESFRLQQELKNENAHLGQEIVDLQHGPGVTEHEQTKRDLERAVLTTQDYAGRIQELTEQRDAAIVRQRRKQAECDALKIAATNTPRTVDAERIRELTDENTQLVLDLEQSQILNVEHLNRLSQLELRNERQAKRLSRIQATVQGQHDA